MDHLDISLGYHNMRANMKHGVYSIQNNDLELQLMQKQYNLRTRRTELQYQLSDTLPLDPKYDEIQKELYQVQNQLEMVNTALGTNT